MKIEENIDVSKLTPIRTDKADWDENGRLFPVYRVKITDLHYNDENGRIATWVSEYRHDKTKPDLRSLDRETYNDVIQSFIMRSNRPDEFNSLKSDISKKSQLKPGVILDDGTVVSGNRRFTALRELYKRTNNPKYLEFECFVIPYPQDEEAREFVKYIETKTQFNVVTQVDYKPIDRLVTFYLYLINPSTCLWSAKDYAKKFGFKLTYVNNMIARAKIMIDYLKYIGHPEEFAIARDKQLDGPIAELASLWNELADNRDEWERIRPFLYSEMGKSGDKKTFVRRAVHIYSKEPQAYNTLLDLLSEKQRQAQFDYETRQKTNVPVAVDEFGNETVLAELDNSVVDKIEESTKKQAVKEKPRKALEKAIDAVKEVDIGIFIRLPQSEILTISSYLDEIEKRVGEIKAALQLKD